MIVGIGIDVVEIERFCETLRRSPAVAARLFVPSEAELVPGSLAGRFAAKEALAKALGAPAGLHWVDVETYVEESGQPRLTMRGTVLARADALGVKSSHVSISHDGGIASAVVVLES
ncbi:holo-ACP synthase [Nocardioidaceae bacterium SCSIO 66511]|nr:holo-ACP synthase [Nocardioidaceae bacterium SCSIO 66511]